MVFKTPNFTSIAAGSGQIQAQFDSVVPLRFAQNTRKCTVDPNAYAFCVRGRLARVHALQTPVQPPEGVTYVPPSPSYDEEPPSPGLQRSGHHHVLSTCAVHVLASPACHIRPGNAGGGAASLIIQRFSKCDVLGTVCVCVQ